MSFQGKTVLITGAASGMRLLSAKCFAKEGANVVMADFDEKNLVMAVEEVRTVAETVIGCTVDVRNYDQVSQCCKKAVETFGTIDILIPFAGGAETRILQAKGDFLNVSSEVIDFGIDDGKNVFYDCAICGKRSNEILYL